MRVQSTAWTNYYNVLTDTTHTESGYTAAFERLDATLGESLKRRRRISSSANRQLKSSPVVAAALTNIVNIHPLPDAFTHQPRNSDFSNFRTAQTFGKLQKCPDRRRFRLIMAALPTELSTDPGDRSDSGGGGSGGATDWAVPALAAAVRNRSKVGRDAAAGDETLA